MCFLRLICYISPFQCQSSESEKGWNERQEKTLPPQRMRRQDDTEETITAQTSRMEGLPAQRLRQEEEEEESLSFVSGVGTDSESPGSKLRQGFPSKIKCLIYTVSEQFVRQISGIFGQTSAIFKQLANCYSDHSFFNEYDPWNPFLHFL
jgi:hypothetical protein